MRAFAGTRCSGTYLNTNYVKPDISTVQRASVSSHFIELASDFPSWADEMAESRLDMNIKVAAFIVTRKFYIIYLSKIFYHCL